MPCWASSLGDCSEKLTREHYVSKGLFGRDVINVQGFHWCKDKMVTIGLGSLTAKILCERHNHELSRIDDAAVRAYNVFREFNRVTNIRRSKPTNKKREVKAYRIDGPRLERWLLKTLINLTFDRGISIGLAAPTEGGLDSDLVAIAFGRKPFLRRMGLYFAIHTGLRLDMTEDLAFRPLTRKVENYIGGMLCSFYGFRLLLFLAPDGPPARLTNCGIDTEDWGDCDLNFHNERIDEYDEKQQKSQVIHIDWYG